MAGRAREAVHEHGAFVLRVTILDDDDYLVNPGLAKLNRREIEIIELSGVTEFPEALARVVEVSQNAARTCAGSSRKPTVGHTGTVFPRSRFYHTQRCRLLVPAEAMQLQGIYVPRSVIEASPDWVIRDLAGNAFETSCCLAAPTTTLLLLSHGTAQHVCLIPCSIGEAQSCIPHDEDDEDWFALAWGWAPDSKINKLL